MPGGEREAERMRRRVARGREGGRRMGVGMREGGRVKRTVE